MKSIRKLLITLSVAYLFVLLNVFLFQRNFLYFPHPSYVPPTQAGADKALQELSVKTEDGLDLIGWYAAATTKPLTIIYFHGNGDYLQNAAYVAKPYIEAGYGFLLAEYRGYSGLPGTPTEAGLYTDAEAFLRRLSAMGIREQDIILLGHSLGTGVAVQMASEFKTGGLILLAPYLSIAKMAQIRFPYLPAEYLARDRFDSAAKIAQIHTPILIINGARDGVIPAAQGQELFAAANEPKSFYAFPERGHNDLFENDASATIILPWLQDLITNRKN